MGGLSSCCCTTTCDGACVATAPVESIAFTSPENGAVTLTFPERAEFRCSDTSADVCFNGDWTAISDVTCSTPWPSGEPVYGGAPSLCSCGYGVPSSFKTWGRQARKALRTKFWAMPRWRWSSEIRPVGIDGTVEVIVKLELRPWASYGTSGGAATRSKSKNYVCDGPNGPATLVGTSDWYEPTALEPLPEPKRCIVDVPTLTACPLTPSTGPPQDPPDSSQTEVGRFGLEGCLTGTEYIYRTTCVWGCTEPYSFCGVDVGSISAFVSLFGGSGPYGIISYEWKAQKKCEELRDEPITLTRFNPGGSTTYRIASDAVFTGCDAGETRTVDLDTYVDVQVPNTLTITVT